MSKQPFTISSKLADLPHLPLSSLTELQGELKDLTTKNYNKLKRSLSEFGIFVPIFVWQNSGHNYILDGHQRKRVLVKEGYTGNVPVVYVEADNLKEAKGKLLVISSQYGTISQEGYDTFTFDLDNEWLDSTVYFDALHFEFGENGQAADGRESQDAEPQIDRAKELQEEWGTAVGQLWILSSRDGRGEHRLICGDCTDRGVVERVMRGEKADITFTSPPYNLGQNIEISNRSQSMKDKGSVYAGGDDSKSSNDYLDLLIKFTSIALSASSYVLVNVQQLAGNKITLIDYLHEYKNHFADVAVWHKTNQQPAMAERVMNSCFEYIFFFSAESEPTRAIKTASFRGQFDNVYTSTINFNEFADVHGAAFPLEFASHFIKAFCPKLCLDPFNGLGTTLIACENLGRYGRAVEISPAYVAVALQRYYDAFQIRPYLATVQGTYRE